MNETTPSLNSQHLLATYEKELTRVANQLGKVNVLIAGNSGVGKSTIINAVFGHRVAATGVGKAQTVEITAYEAPDRPLRIYDTRGFEIAHADETIAVVHQKIRELRAQTEADQQIHVAWTCLLEQSHRVEPVQGRLLALLNENQIPALVLITQAFEQNAEMEASVRSLAVPNQGVLSILAETKQIAGHRIDPHGVHELVERTLQLLPEAQHQAFIAAQNVRWDLKEQAIRKQIDQSAALAAATALMPIPGGHSMALIGIQLNLLAQIIVILGLSRSQIGTKEIIGLVGILTSRTVGKWVFSLAFTEAAKIFPGLGTLSTVGSAAIGGSIGAALTKTLGHVFYDAVKESARTGQPLPSAEILADSMDRLLQQNREHYERLANQS